MSLKKDILMKETVNKAGEYIKENYHREDISLKKVSRAVSLNYYYFSHMFREYGKMSFVEYLTKIRLQEAIKLLKNPRLSLAQVAFAVGYQDRGYFGKAFKKAYKISPSQFRERVLEGGNSFDREKNV